MQTSYRRARLILYTSIVSFLVVLYVTFGARQTSHSVFYKRTLALMESRYENAVDNNARSVHVDPNDPAHKQFDSSLLQAKHQAKPPGAPFGVPVSSDLSLKERLRQAEQAAKQSADHKYKALKDIENAIREDKAARRAGAPDEARGLHVPLHHEEQQVLHEAIEKEKPEPPPPPPDPSKELKRILGEAPVVIFSKSYCPYSRKAKTILLDIYSIEPEPYVVELDQHVIGSELQDLLLEETGRRTVPNILVAGKTIGGGDDIEELWKTKKLKKKLFSVGKGLIKSVTKRTTGAENQESHGHAQNFNALNDRRQKGNLK